MSMGAHARRFAILLTALSSLSVTLVACQTTGPSAGSSGNSGGTFSFTTPNPALQSPTPTFPAFTIGAWPSNYTPQALDNITIYVICRVQNQSMSGPAQPPPSLTVTVQVSAPINKTLTGTTDADGLAAIPLSFSDPSPGTPVVVTVFTSWNGHTYSNQTFFTPGATYTPTPTSGPSVTPSVSATP